MKGTVISPEGVELSINLLEIEGFKKGSYTHAPIKSGERITDFIVVFDPLGFTKGLPINIISSVLAQKEIRGVTLIVTRHTFKTLFE